MGSDDLDVKEFYRSKKADILLFAAHMCVRLTENRMSRQSMRKERERQQLPRLTYYINGSKLIKLTGHDICHEFLKSSEVLFEAARQN